HHEQTLGVGEELLVAEQAAREVALAPFLAVDRRLDPQVDVERRDPAVVDVEVGGPGPWTAASVAQPAEDLVEQERDRAAVGRPPATEVAGGERTSTGRGGRRRAPDAEGRRERVAATGELRALPRRTGPLLDAPGPQEPDHVGQVIGDRGHDVRRGSGAGDEV